MIKMIERIHERASKRLLLLALAVTIIASVMIIFLLPQFLVFSEGQLPLDMRTFYTPTEFIMLVEVLGAEGIVMYHVLQIADMIFPIALAITLSSTIALINRVILPHASRPRKAAVVPFFTALFDYSENFLIWYQLDMYPMTSSNLLWITSFISALKLSLLTVSLVIAAGWIGMYLLKKETII